MSALPPATRRQLTRSLAVIAPLAVAAFVLAATIGAAIAVQAGQGTDAADAAAVARANKPAVRLVEETRAPDSALSAVPELPALHGVRERRPARKATRVRKPARRVARSPRVAAPRRAAPPVSTAQPPVASPQPAAPQPAAPRPVAPRPVAPARPKAPMPPYVGKNFDSSG